MSVLAVLGYYFILEGFFCLLLTQEHWRRTVGALLSLAPGQLRTVGLLLTGGSLLMLSVLPFHPFFAAIGFYLILSGGTMLLSPTTSRRLINMVFTFSQIMLLYLGAFALLGGGFLLWMA